MMPGWTVFCVSLAYLLLLFGVAYWADKRADAGRSVIGTPTIYTLSLAVYCTTWTYYGSVGRATSLGVGFLPIYLGPTLMMILGWSVIRKIRRIAGQQRVTSIADFIASRYGRSPALGGLVAIIAVIGITPYIALQLKAVAVSFDVLSGLDPAGVGTVAQRSFLLDKAFYVALMMAAFAVLFGTRHIDAAEHHEGLVAAVALESLVKLLAFLTVGIFVTFILFDGPGALFAAARSMPDIAPLLTDDPVLADGGWATMTVLSALAILCLPRQFHLAIIENKDERHIKRAMWLFPLYMLLINLFVLPVAVAGLLSIPEGTVDPDMFVLALPLREGLPVLALVVFVGGLSAATAMVVVETIALSTMVCNDLVMPVLLRWRFLRLDRRTDLSGLLLGIRRIAIVAILLLGYGYFRFAGSAYALVAIGLISFAAVAQFAPALLGGIFWKGGSRRGAIAGLAAGVAVWAYTLLLPSFARSGWLPAAFIENGPWDMAVLRPYALFGLEDFDPLTHALFWSAIANIGLYVGVSLFDRRDRAERVQAAAFVDVFHGTGNRRPEPSDRWSGQVSVGDLRRLTIRFLGAERAARAFDALAAPYGSLSASGRADPALVRGVERLLAGAVGAASARVALSSAVQGGGVTRDELMRVLDETSQAIEYGRQLEQKSAELERTSTALRTANDKLRELDKLKDEFLSTVTHELRTPLTSIRSLSEILYDNPDMTADERQTFLAVIVSESERLTRLINQVLDMAKIEAGAVEWRIAPIDLTAVIADAIITTAPLFREKGVELLNEVPRDLPPVLGDRDRLMQVVINLLSNAVKFAPTAEGTVRIGAVHAPDTGMVKVSVTDNGPGVAPADAAVIFDMFRQGGHDLTDKPPGTGLGLAICRRIVEHLGGEIRVERTRATDRGATFSFTIPIASTKALPEAAEA